MYFRRCVSLTILLSITGLAGAQIPVRDANLPVAPQAHCGYLFFPLEDGAARKDLFYVHAYVPQPGDIILYDQNSTFYHAAFKFAGISAPTHAAMVVDREDGTCGLLDITGAALITARVGILDLMPRLSAYPGTIMVRRLRTPLTPEESHNLTLFARSQAGKKLALGRLLLFMTPMSPRKGTPHADHVEYQRNRWYCSEIVVAAGYRAHIFDPHVHRADGAVPRDLAFDETMDLSQLYFNPAMWAATWVPANVSSLPSK